MKSLVIYFSWALIVLNLCQPTCFAQLDPEKEDLINRLVQEQFIPENNVTGMSLSIVQNGEIILSKGYLYQDIEKGILTTNQTLFSIGSISKSFIGVLVVKILSEKFPESGEAILDEPVVKVAPNFNVTFSDRNRAESMSFRDLLSHRACLENLGMDLTFASVRSNKEYSYRTRYQKESCTFRNGFTYSNSLYALSGELIASIVNNGKNIHQLMREFMVEIGMVDSTTIDSSGSYESNPQMSQGYYIKDEKIHKFNLKLLRRVDVGLGAAGILSTSNDMAKYGQFHLNQGKVGNKQIVSKEAMSWLYKISSNPVPTFSGQGEYGYGLGLFLALWNGDQWITHSGYWAPFKSRISFFPRWNISIYMVTNGPGLLNHPVTQEFVTLEILNILRGVKTNNKMTPQVFKSSAALPLSNSGQEFTVQNMMKNGIRARRSTKPDDVRNKRTQIDFNEVVGVYGEPTAGDLTITLDSLDNSSLKMNYGEWGIAKLFPTNNPVQFDLSWQTDLLQLFYTNVGSPAPVFGIDLSSQDSVILTIGGVGFLHFKKENTLDRLPAIPWESDSCGPAGMPLISL